MKYRLVRNDVRPSYPGKPYGWVPDDMVHMTETREVMSSGRLQKLVFWKAGEEFDNQWGPDMVRAGVAEPLDDECREASERTPEQIAVAQKAYARTKAGIHPEDFEAYEKGYMTGYLDGEWIPGPNHSEWLALQKAEEEDDE